MPLFILQYKNIIEQPGFPFVNNTPSLNIDHNTLRQAD